MPAVTTSTACQAASHERQIGILASAASGLSEFIQQQGGSPERILGMAGIDPEQLLHPTLSLDLNQYCSVFEEAARQTGNHNFGLRYGQQFRPDSLGFLGYVGLCSATLGECLRNVARTFPAHQQGSLLRLVEEGQWCRFDYQVQHGAILRKRQDAELSMGMFSNLIRHALGQNWAPERVLFEHPQPEAWHEHCKVFDAPVLFGQPCNALVFRRSVLERPMPDHDPKLLAILLESMGKLCHAGMGQAQPGIVAQVRAQVRDLLGEGYPSLEHVAQNLRIPTWTIQRRLSESGLSFSTLVDTVRQELALYYLQQSTLPISELALALGYSEISAFSRAFRRWYDVSPIQWRQAHRGADGHAT
ncbi:MULTISPECIES: AraC family transcriptional regulator [Pseudomonas]|uniref:AraC family transcriptional regulator n=1 Tax=Pseudomonas sessilinigenes TaxID=658629 RepID=A0ABX8MYQ1_9PSED|nr:MULTISPECIES: AraC family transcriptional regulator [Pseudomonas]AZC24533.1 Transcriptional regulator, AraC family [Pseudomonas sessilinigenes]QIH08342.1 AraC family transcriptional regulator [Pseudomonas sp. BIOMIG1BAC]QXH43464.1 AraC family transcriptional regulator [Pseudomonas sessilinigenes]